MPEEKEEWKTIKEVGCKILRKIGEDGKEYLSLDKDCHEMRDVLNEEKWNFRRRIREIEREMERIEKGLTMHIDKERYDALKLEADELKNRADVREELEKALTKFELYELRAERFRLKSERAKIQKARR